MGDNRPVLAIDVGGTKLAAGVVDRRGRLVVSARKPTPQGRRVTADTIWRTLGTLVEEVLDEYGRRPNFAGVGVGCSGPMTWPAGEVSPLNIPAWRDFPLRKLIAERFPRAAVRLHNDAVTMAVGEHWRGAGQGVTEMLGIVVSTGVGGGMILGGELVDGASGNAGHVGHIVVDPQGPDCPCGGRGCLEAVAAGPALVRWAQERDWRAGQRRRPTARDLSTDAARGHEVATAALRRGGEALGVAVASATALCDFEVVAVGGGLAQAGPLLFGPAEEAFRSHAGMDFTQKVRIVPAALGQQAGLVGAAGLVLAGNTYWNSG
ncbi:MAG: ROK family protein [Streptosporangiales bacterium]|nr:ROK family protein [Streptosporangiales bacterium]